MKKFLLSSIALALSAASMLAQPTITQQLTNQVVAVGGTMTLSVTASDPLAAYQWFKDGRLLLGATNNALTVTNASAINSGAYFVTVTNGSGMVISLPALVAVGNPALLGWGNDQYGQLGDGQSGNPGTTVNVRTPEIILGNAITATAGANHSLFLTADGTLWATGFNNWGQLGNGTRTNANKPLSVASNVVAVGAGQNHSLFLKSDGTLWAMGLNNSGQLGSGTGILQTNPVPVISGTNVVAVAAGFNHSLFLKSDGTLWAMGNNAYGQLGNATTGNQTSPVPVIGGSNVVAMAAGSSHSLFLKSDGTLWAMGYNNYGQLGNGTINQTNQPMLAATNVLAVAAGSSHSIFISKDGTLWAMGYNNYGQLGNATMGNQTSPVPVIGGSNVVAMAAGSSHSLFLKSDDTLWAMGYNNNGQLGDGTTTTQTTPVPVPVVAISLADVYSGSSANHSVAIGQPLASAATQAPMPVTATNATLNGMTIPNGLPTTVWFEWGLRGSFTQTTSPVNVGSGNTVVRVSALISGLSSSNVYQCSLVASNSMGVTTGAVQWFRVDYAPKMAAWGDNSYGQLQVPQNLTNVVAVTRGALHSLALQADGTVRAWGLNSFGACDVPASATNVVALGGGSGEGGYVPAINLALRNDGSVVPWGTGATVPTGLKNVVAVAAGDAHCIVLQAGGQVVAWLDSYNSNYGQATVPGGLTNVVAVGGGAYHSLALTANGTVAAWGYNGDGEINVPPSATNVIAIAAGSFHNLALRADGTIVAWGDDSVRQTDVPVGLSNVVAVAAGGFHSMALKSDGTVATWGAADLFIGNNSDVQAIVPLGLSNVVAIAAGGFHSLVLGGNVPPVAISQTNSGFVNQDLVITPTVSDPNNDALTCRVTVLPVQGALFQYAGSARGQQITAPNTTITDASLRVIFAPAPNNEGNPYTTFGLVANDGQADSLPATMVVNIVQTPQSFTAQNLGSGLQIQFAGTANYPYILQVATNLTPPVNWQSILTNPANVNGNWSFTVTNLSAVPAGFYRAVGQ